MIPIPEVSLLLRGWIEDKRRLRIIARLGGTDVAVFCRVHTADDNSFCFAIGNDVRDMIGFLFEGWVFDFKDAPSNDNELVIGGVIESAICGVRPDGRTLMIMLLEA